MFIVALVIIAAFTGTVFAQGTVPSMQEAKQMTQPKKEVAKAAVMQKGTEMRHQGTEKATQAKKAVTKKLEAKETKTAEIKEAAAEKTKEATAAPVKPAVKKYHKKHYAKPVEQKSPEAK